MSKEIREAKKTISSSEIFKYFLDKGYKGSTRLKRKKDGSFKPVVFRIGYFLNLIPLPLKPHYKAETYFTKQLCAEKVEYSGSRGEYKKEFLGGLEKFLGY